MNELVELMYRYKHSRHYKERERYHVVLLVKSGKTIKQTAELFYVDEDTIISWVKKWDEEYKVSDNQRSGRPKKLTKEQEEEIVRLVDQNKPSEHGYKTSTWDCVELIKYVEDHFSFAISDETLRKTLKKYGFSYKKINYLFNKRDEEIRRKFVEEIFYLYESLKNTKIMFCDEMSTKLHPKQGYVWTRDEKAVVATSCSHKRINTIGAIEPLIGEKVIGNYDKNDTDSFIQFLTELESKTEKNILLILDNYPVHHSNKVKSYLEKTGRISLKHLPAYSPDLNPIEWLWGYARKKYLNCVSPPNITELKNILEESFKSISNEKVRHICRLDVIRKHLIT